MPMTTWTALTTLPEEGAAAALADALEDLTPEPTGIGIFEMEDGSGLWEIGGYFTAKPDVAALGLLAAMHGARPFAVSRVEDRDWVAQVRRELSPVHAGRFVVHGGHDRALIPGHLIGLEIEAAMAFGTGHHGTTKGCLLALDRLCRRGWMSRNTADIGCGTGVLAMAASAVWGQRVIATDIDAVAVATARANVRANRLGAAVLTAPAAGFCAPVLHARAPYDLIFANILARPLRRMAADMARHSRAGSILILSGILNRQAKSVVATYAGHRFQCRDRIVIGEWTTLILRRF